MSKNDHSRLAGFIPKLHPPGKQVTRDIIFWCVIYFYYVSTIWPSYEDKMALFEKLFVKTGMQIGLTYVILSFLVPRFLLRKQKIFFVSGTLLSVYLTYALYTAYRYYFFDPRYPGIYREFDILERLSDVNFFFTELTWFLFPAAILLALEYYREQREVISLREQKRKTELKLLKTQLNPHFLFNTLNNLYILALKKSEKTPELIAKLSAILDYMLYQCNDKYVALADEIKLMNNYIDLEKLRYGERVKVDFEYRVEKAVEVAPLILLTFLENAFKHGVKEEINKASIQVNLRASQEEIWFEVQNSKPQIAIEDHKTVSIGLQNIREQLDLLYPKRNTLEVEDRDDFHRVTLKLSLHEV